MTFSSGEHAKGEVGEGQELCSPLSFKTEEGREKGLQKVILKAIHTSASHHT